VTAKHRSKRRWPLVLSYVLVAVLVLGTGISVLARGAVVYLEKHPDVLETWLENYWQADVHLGAFTVASKASVLSLDVEDFSVKDDA